MRKKLLITELGRCSNAEFKTKPKRPFIVILDHVRSKHNVGSAFRTGDAFAIEHLALCGITGTPPDAEIHKTALGAEDALSWSYHPDTLSYVQSLKEQGYTVLAVEQTHNSKKLPDFHPEAHQKYAFIFGNEVKGVQQSVIDISDDCLEIPQEGTKHSLNVSVSIGIVLWQALQSQ